MPRTIALIVAGGRGSRFDAVLPKQYACLQGKAVLRHTVEAFCRHPLIEAVQLVIHPADQERCQQAMEGIALLPCAYGGETRQESVRLGLKAIEHLQPEKVLIHDAARPFLSTVLITEVIEKLDDVSAVVPVVPVLETVKEVEEDKIVSTLERSKLFRAQTPQGFHFPLIFSLHEKMQGGAYTDDAVLCENAGISVHTVRGEEGNIKITTQEDRIKMQGPLFETRVGMGFDAHKFKEPAGAAEPHVMVCGVRIPHPVVLEAHSDGDVGLHALVDALLGTIGAGDIGMHFSPADPRWKGADSSQFVTYSHELIQQKQGIIVNVDITIIGESPKIGPYREAMKKRVAEILGISEQRVSIKATTTEKMGFTGRKEGIAAQAVASVKVPV